MKLSEIHRDAVAKNENFLQKTFNNKIWKSVIIDVYREFFLCYMYMCVFRDVQGS